MCSNTLHDLNVIKLTVTHVVATWGFLIRYSNYHKNKRTANDRNSMIIFNKTSLL